MGTRVREAVLAGHTGAVKALVVLLDWRLASSGKDSTVRLWDVDPRVHAVTAPKA